MTDGKEYVLDPPANINGKIIRRAECEFRVPNQSDEYSLRGVPEGEDEPISFLLKMTGGGNVGFHEVKED